MNEFREFIKTRMMIKNKCQMSNVWTKNNGKYLEKINSELYKYALSLNCRSLSEALYLIYNDIKAQPICPICKKNPKSFITFKMGYKEHCSTSCAAKDKKVQEKAKQTNLEKYGVEHPLKSKKIQEKIKQTNLEKYGVEHLSKSKEIQEKIKQTNLEKYGVQHPMKLNEIKKKIKDTNLKRYGVEYVFQSNVFKSKRKETIMKKYGVEHQLKSKEIQEKIKQTNLEKYGVEYPRQSEEMKNKWKKKYKENFYDKFKEQLLERKIELISTKDEYINNDIFKFKCLICNTIFKSTGTNHYQVNCKCRKSISNKEIEIYNWLISLNINASHSNRNIISPLELDIYLPDYNLAIEFDGIYWHSENMGINKNYHLNKTLKCKENGIQLIHIFENEWEFNKNIVKSIILAKLGKFEKRIMARKCQLKELTNEEYKNFVELNHIQGYVPAKYKIGLFYNDELVQICSFGKSRFKNDEIELIRHCSKLNTQIIGGLSKLLSYYKFDNLVTYVDLRYGNGNGYKDWELIEQTKPNYWYFKKGDIITKLESRMKYQKYKLKKILEKFNPNLSEWDNMQENNFYRIWDCGNLKLKYIKN